MGHKELRGHTGSDKQLDPLTDGLPADGAGFERGAAVDAGGVSALEDQLDVVVDADGAGDPLLHLAVARLQLLQQVVLLRVLGTGAAVHLRLVCGRKPPARVIFSQVQRISCNLFSLVRPACCFTASGSRMKQLNQLNMDVALLLLALR